METGDRGHGKKSQKGRKTQRKAPTGLGFKAMQSFIKNQESVTGFIDALEDGSLDLSKFFVGRVKRPVGMGHFDVTKLPSGEVATSAGIAGFLKGGSAAAGTYISPDSIVIIHDDRRGEYNRGRTHTIIGVLAPHQADRVFGMLGVRAAGEEDDLFERGGEEEAAHAELAAVRSELAAMRRSVAARKSSSSNAAGSVAASRKSSSSSYNLEANMAAAVKAAKSEKKKRQFHTRKARKAAAKAAEATGAGGSAKWF
jgi:hypothetical protein